MYSKRAAHIRFVCLVCVRVRVFHFRFGMERTVCSSGSFERFVLPFQVYVCVLCLKVWFVFASGLVSSEHFVLQFRVCVRVLCFRFKFSFYASGLKSGSRFVLLVGIRGRIFGCRFGFLFCTAVSLSGVRYIISFRVRVLFFWVPFGCTFCASGSSTCFCCWFGFVCGCCASGSGFMLPVHVLVRVMWFGFGFGFMLTVIDQIFVMLKISCIKSSEIAKMKIIRFFCCNNVMKIA